MRWPFVPSPIPTVHYLHVQRLTSSYSHRPSSPISSYTHILHFPSTSISHIPSPPTLSSLPLLIPSTIRIPLLAGIARGAHDGFIVVRSTGRRPGRRPTGRCGNIIFINKYLLLLCLPSQLPQPLLLRVLKFGTLALGAGHGAGTSATVAGAAAAADISVSLCLWCYRRGSRSDSDVFVCSRASSSNRSSRRHGWRCIHACLATSTASGTRTRRHRPVSTAALVPGL